MNKDFLKIVQSLILIIQRLFMMNLTVKFLLRIIYISLIGASFVSCLDFSKYHPGYKYSLLYSLIPIFMYNGKNGKKNKFIQTMFYMIFPIQHIILYFLAMFITGN